MSSPRPLEQTLLSPVEAELDMIASAERAAEAHAIRLEVLEGVASRLGGFSLGAYRELTGVPCTLSAAKAGVAADRVLWKLRKVPIHPSLALTALARPPLSKLQRRSTGGYFTDFRLADLLVSDIPADPTLQVIDPASGTGILLVAAALHACGYDRSSAAVFLRNAVAAADLSEEALRGAKLALASLTDDVDAIEAMLPRFRRIDSLLTGADVWKDVAPDGFSVVIGNPPWEKLKLNRHEFAASASDGEHAHYGAEVNLSAEKIVSLGEQRRTLASYTQNALGTFNLQGSGEADLYKLFLELGFRLAAPEGRVAMLVPAGLIRSQGTTDLRRFLIRGSVDLRIGVLENRARFFAIDTRFKFLALRARLGRTGATPILLQHVVGTDSGYHLESEVRLGRASLSRVRPDLSIPEVRTPKEWSLFRRMTVACPRLGAEESVWKPRICREVDMTRDRGLFTRERSAGGIPVVEGRMVHQHRFGAKAYRSGSGRKAIWEPLPLQKSEVVPQFWVAPSGLRREVQQRVDLPRAGFCDVTGQTNERSLLAARIPPGVVCGNKVPTILFGEPGDPPSRSEGLLQLWLALANSFATDWYLRRVVTTTVNYFILLALPFPNLDPESLPAQRLVALTRSVEEAAARGDWWDMANLRGEIDARILGLYGLTFDDATTIVQDFPLLDRGQPPLLGEASSTVTRDVFLLHTARLLGAPTAHLEERVAEARCAGSIPYVPAEWDGGHIDPEEGVNYG